MLSVAVDVVVRLQVHMLQGPDGLLFVGADVIGSSQAENDGHADPDSGRFDGADGGGRPGRRSRFAQLPPQPVVPGLKTDVEPLQPLPAELPQFRD